MDKTETRGQLKLQKILNDLGFETVLEYSLGPYFIDCWLSECALAVEYDGPVHGMSKKRDSIRDSDLVDNYGVKAVIRIREDDLADPEGIAEKVLTAASPA